MIWVKKLIVLFIILFLFAPNAIALEIIPNAKGYGITTEAGSGRSEGPWSTTIRYVTNLDNTGAGSFRQAIADHDGSGTPSVIVFEVSGTISLTSSVTIDGDYLTIAGQTAPSPGIEFKTSVDQPMIWNKASDVLIQHLRFRPGDDACDTADNLDAFAITSAIADTNNVIVDHCSFAWSIDEIVSIWGGDGYETTNITFRNCIFGPGLHASCHTKGDHSKGPLVAQGAARSTGASNILFHRNLFYVNNERNPMSRAEEILIVNNLVYGWTYRATHFAGQAGFSSIVQEGSVVGNYYLRESWTGVGKPIWTYGISAGDDQLYAGSEIYVDDNICPGYSPCYQYSTGSDPFDDGGSDPISWPTDLAGDLVSGADAKQYVLDDVGARPLDRDTVDTDTIAAVVAEDGTIINCVERDLGNADCDEVGEYAYITRPTLAANTVAFTPPANPNDDAGDGWTNLEEALADLAIALELVQTGGGPSGLQACIANPTPISLEITTNTERTCKAHTTDVAYSAMSITFDTTGAKSHSHALSLACADSYTYYILCDRNGTSTQIDFTVGGDPPPPTDIEASLLGGSVSGGGFN